MSGVKRARSASVVAPAPAESQCLFDDDDDDDASDTDTDVDESTAHRCMKLATLARPRLRVPQPGPLETLENLLTSYCSGLDDRVADAISVPALFPDDFAAEVEGILMGKDYAGTRHCTRVPGSVLEEADFDEVLRLARELEAARGRVARRVAERVHAYSLGVAK